MSPRMAMEERREIVLRQSIPVFARYGFEGATTAEIAKQAGVTQPYIFKLFGSKKALFIEACERNMRTTVAQMRESAGGKTGAEALKAMGVAYVERMENDRDSLLLQMQQYAACWDEDVQRTVRTCMGEMWEMVIGMSQVPVEEAAVFFAKGMMCNVMAAADRSYGSDPQWQPMIEALWSHGDQDAAEDAAQEAVEHGADSGIG